ncbi:hypothetical protein GXP70_02355 [Paenibacillus lycopersici]|uniref:SLH domain-containing protein n=1 Tax=Paenibacillus lycopersici TaxID=2704462 RepID=A0A6C0FP85_9BACL|nr:cadherin-like beta sandwich domain-containing protein [Paenibacillus lycopersici]QHT58928.1 hypothetical protein GXP70_02355 [Paenibacillus lycopersici]
MGFKIRRLLMLFAVCLLVTELLTGLIPIRDARVFAGTGGEIYTFAGGNYGDSGDGGSATDAELSNPSAVAVDGSGNLYIADTDNNKIRKVLTDGSISTVAGNGNYGYAGDEGQAVEAELRSPAGVAIDSAGNLYIADKYNNRVRRVAPDGVITTIAGTGSSDYAGDNGPAVDAALSSPSGVAVDSAGNLYIADTSNHRIRKVDTTGFITTVAGSDDSGYSGDGGPAVDARLYYPNAVAVDDAGNLYIADTYNNRIRKVDISGNISTVAGTSGTDGYSGDGGLAVDAQLNEPEGITVDGSGNLYIADTDNNRIRKVIPNGIIMTITGTGTAGYSGDGAPGKLAEIDGPAGLAMSSGGDMYIADKYNYAIRKQVTYIPSSDASLTNIVLSSGTLSPAFAPGTFEYAASVVNGVSSIRVTPTTSDSLITVKVNGESVASGSQSGDITLDVGSNTITLAALAEDGVTTKTYTITIERLRSSNANLSQLTLSGGPLSPAFAPNITSYTANASQSEITVTPTMADAMATVKVNGATVANGAASPLIPLAVGITAITIDVTAQDGTTTKTYTINVTRTISSNADLSGLVLSNGTLSPTFRAETTNYTASVGNGVSSITVKPTVADGSSAVSVNDVPVTSGGASASLPLIVGSNAITVKVTAEDGTVKTYTVTVSRAASSNADLSGLELSGGMLTPSFLPGTYKANVGNNVSNVTIKPTAADPAHATVTVSLYNGSGTLVSGPSPVASGAASPSLALDVGSNTISLSVTAEDGTTRTYTVTVTRGASGNAELSDLTLSSGTLTPAFGGTYTAAVGNSVSSITVTATFSDAANATAAASVYDNDGTLASGPHTLASGAESTSLPLSVGRNVISILVTAQDGSLRTYTVTVTRAALGGSADLSGLILSGGTLSPVFDADTTSYTSIVGNSVNSITLTPTTEDGRAAVSVNDEPIISGGTSTIPLAAGSNAIAVKVTAEDGTIKTYTVTVSRAAGSNADLSDLELSGGMLTPSFLPGTYKASVDNNVSSVTIKPTAADPSHATITVSLYNGSGALVSGPSPVASGTASPSLALGVGSNTISLSVTAEDGTTKTYTVTVTRGASSNAELSHLTLSSGTLTPAFGGTYTAAVGNSVSSITVTATFSDAANATAAASVYDGDGTLASGPHPLTGGAESPSLPLSVGSNTISILVTAQDGVSRTYTVTVTRAALSNGADLSGLVLSNGTLSPGFEPFRTDYTSSVDNSVDNVTVTIEAPDEDMSEMTVSVYNSSGTLIGGPFDMSSGTAAFSLPLVVGSNEIAIIVRTNDNVTNTYKVKIARAAAPAIGGGAMPPVNIPLVDDQPVIDLNGQEFDLEDIDTNQPYAALEATPQDGVVIVNIPASVLTELAIQNPGFYLELKTPYGSYQVPVDLALIIPELPKWMAKYNLQAADLGFKFVLTDRSEDPTLQSALEEDLPGGEAISDMVDFHLEIVNRKTGQSIGTVERFSQAITRILPLSGRVSGMPKQWGAFRYNETTKQYEFVPARTVSIDGLTYALIRSYSNSVYVVVDHAISFKDVNRGWSKPLIELAASKGIIQGTGDGKFEPARTVTRAEFVTMLVRALGRGGSADSSSPYNDVKPDAWYSEAVVDAKSLGLLDFAGGRIFLPNRPLTREEMASMLAAALTMEHVPIPGKYVDLEAYQDVGSIQAAYLESVRTMIRLNIMTGTGADTFSPKETTTREQAAAVIIRTLQALGWLDI